MVIYINSNSYIYYIILSHINRLLIHTLYYYLQGATDYIDLKFNRLKKPCYAAFNSKSKQPRRHFPYDDNDMLIFPITHPPSKLLKIPQI